MWQMKEHFGVIFSDDIWWSAGRSISSVCEGSLIRSVSLTRSEMLSKAPLSESGAVVVARCEALPGSTRLQGF